MLCGRVVGLGEEVGSSV